MDLTCWIGVGKNLFLRQLSLRGATRVGKTQHWASNVDLARDGTARCPVADEWGPPAAAPDALKLPGWRVIPPDFFLEFGGFFPREKSRKTRGKSGAFRKNSDKNTGFSLAILLRKGILSYSYERFYVSTRTSPPARPTHTRPASFRPVPARSGPLRHLRPNFSLSTEFFPGATGFSPGATGFFPGATGFYPRAGTGFFPRAGTHLLR